MPVLDRCKISAMPVFWPSINVITSITQALQAVVTTNTAHNYVDGTIVRLDVTEACGMYQINTMYAPITVLSPTTFAIDIDSSMFEPFAIPVAPGVHVNICSLVVPIGEVNATLKAAVVNIL